MKTTDPVQTILDRLQQVDLTKSEADRLVKAVYQRVWEAKPPVPEPHPFAHQ